MESTQLQCPSTFQCNPESGAEGVERQGVRSNHSSHVANTGVVAAAEDAADQGASNTAVHNQFPVPAKPSWQNT